MKLPQFLERRWIRSGMSAAAVLTLVAVPILALTLVEPPFFSPAQAGEEISLGALPDALAFDSPTATMRSESGAESEINTSEALVLSDWKFTGASQKPPQNNSVKGKNDKDKDKDEGKHDDHDHDHDHDNDHDHHPKPKPTCHR